MAEPTNHVAGSRPEAVLRERLTRFVGNHSVWKASLRETLGRIERQGWPAVIFGGVLRDLMVFGLSERPRDVDIVVDQASQEDIAAIFRDHKCRRTRFGGVRLNAKGWLVDIWPLRETWAFREHRLPLTGFEDLPKTTFLNVEAIAADLNAPRGHQRRLYSFHFFKAIESRVLDINFEPNPFPGLCIVRALITAARMNLQISPRLAQYITSGASRIETEELVRIQEEHYGSVRLTAGNIEEWISFIHRQLQRHPAEPTRLPVRWPEQLNMREEWTSTI